MIQTQREEILGKQTIATPDAGTTESVSTTKPYNPDPLDNTIRRKKMAGKPPSLDEATYRGQEKRIDKIALLPEREYDDVTAILRDAERKFLDETLTKDPENKELQKRSDELAQEARELLHRGARSDSVVGDDAQAKAAEATRRANETSKINAHSTNSGGEKATPGEMSTARDNITANNTTANATTTPSYRPGGNKNE